MALTSTFAAIKSNREYLITDSWTGKATTLKLFYSKLSSKDDIMCMCIGLYVCVFVLVSIYNYFFFSEFESKELSTAFYLGNSISEFNCAQHPLVELILAVFNFIYPTILSDFAKTPLRQIDFNTNI